MILRLAAARSSRLTVLSLSQYRLRTQEFLLNFEKSPVLASNIARMSSTATMTATTTTTATITPTSTTPYKAPSSDAIAGCQAAVYEWAESFDNKDWERLRQNIAPTLYVDYRSVMGKMWESMPRDEFVGLVTNPHFIGNMRIKTQHFVGASKFVYKSDTEVTGYHQMRVAHQKYKDDEMKEVLHKGHAHGRVTIEYRLVDGVWRFAGLTPDIRWSEYDYDKIFGPDA